MEVKPLRQSSVPAGYKQTEVGVIPVDWDFDCLGNLSEFITSGSRGWARYYSDRGALFIRSQNVRDGRLDFTDQQFVNPPQGSEGSRTRVTCSDLLITVTGNSVGNVALVEYDLSEAYISQHVGLVRLLPSTNGQYVCRFLSPGSPGNKQIWGSQSGQSKPGLTLKNLQDFWVAIPPRSEQRAIAEALSDVDGLLGALDRLIAKKRDLKQAAMQQLLTGQTRLPGFHGEWEAVSMRQVLTQNATYGIVTAGTFVQNGVKMLRGGDIVDARINTDLPMVSREKAAEYARTALVKDDVVIALVGYPGASATIPDELIGANISRAVGLLRTKGKVSPDFLVCFLNSSDGRRMVLAPSAGSAQQVVNLAALNKLQFRIPILPEQTAIAEVLTDMDAELAGLEQRREKIRALKQAMMQELLTGRTRLI